MTLATVFEKETCGRCGGSGRYSYNQMHGSTCYGCAGKGERLTKRGAAASLFYVESCKVPARDLVVGDVIGFSGVTLGGSSFTRKAAIERIEQKEQLYKSGAACNYPDAPWQVAAQLGFWATIRGEQNGTVVSPDSLVRKFWPADVNAAKIAAALDYQASLTKAGKPARR